MLTRATRLRGVLAAGYFAVAYLVLFFYTAGSLFCSRPGEAGHAIITARLAVACTLLDSVASLCGVALCKRLNSAFGMAAVCVIVGAALVSAPFWIYRGYGVFLFEHTFADVSCFFTEGYGMMFPVIVAPLLAVATFAREWIFVRATK
jgi:hypothetical protein